MVMRMIRGEVKAKVFVLECGRISSENSQLP